MTEPNNNKMNTNKHQLIIVTIFASDEFLQWFWPRYYKNTKQNTWNRYESRLQREIRLQSVEFDVRFSLSNFI